MVGFYCRVGTQKQGEGCAVAQSRGRPPARTGSGGLGRVSHAVLEGALDLTPTMGREL